MKHRDKLAASLLMGTSMFAPAILNDNTLLGTVVFGAGAALCLSNLPSIIKSVWNNEYTSTDPLSDLRQESEQRERAYWRNERRKEETYEYEQKFTITPQKYNEVLKYALSVADRRIEGLENDDKHEFCLSMEDGRIKFHNFDRKTKYGTIELSENVPSEIKDKILSMAYSNPEQDPRAKAMDADPWFSAPSEFLEHENQYRERWAEATK